MNATEPNEFISLAHIARLAGRAPNTTANHLKRVGIIADGEIAAGRGMMPIFRSDRVPAILGAIAGSISRTSGAHTRAMYL